MQTKILKLTNETIDLLSDEISLFFSSKKVSKKEILRYRLSLEESLIKYQEKFGTDVSLVYDKKAIFGQIRFTIKIFSSSFNPFSITIDDENNELMSSLVNSFEKGEPLWNYDNQTNILVFSAKKEVNFGKLPQIGIAVVLAFVIGILARNIFVKESLNAFVESYVVPIGNVYAGAMSVMGVLLLFFDISLGIVNCGDLSTAGKLGKRFLGRYFIILAIFVVGLSIPLLFLFNEGAHIVGISGNETFKLIIGFVPQNIVRPFLDFNAIQVCIIGLAFGVSMLVLGEKSSTLRKVFNEVDLVAIVTNGFIDKVIAIYAFIELFGLVSTAELSVLRYSVTIFAVIIGGLFIMLAASIVRASIIAKISPIKLMKKLLPSFLLCIGTGSYCATFTENIGVILNDLGISSGYAGLGMEFGGNLYKPAQAFSFLAMSMFIANFYNIKVTIPWFIIACILSIIMSVAVPNIPGGALTIIPLLFSQLSLPPEGVNWMILLASILQFPILAININCMQCELLCVASKYDEVDTSKLYAT